MNCMHIKLIIRIMLYSIQMMEDMRDTGYLNWFLLVKVRFSSSKGFYRMLDFIRSNRFRKVIRCTFMLLISYRGKPWRMWIRVIWICNKNACLEITIPIIRGSSSSLFQLISYPVITTLSINNLAII